MRTYCCNSRHASFLELAEIRSLVYKSSCGLALIVLLRKLARLEVSEWKQITDLRHDNFIKPDVDLFYYIHVQLYSKVSGHEASFQSRFLSESLKNTNRPHFRWTQSHPSRLWIHLEATHAWPPKSDCSVLSYVQYMVVLYFAFHSACQVLARYNMP